MNRCASICFLWALGLTTLTSQAQRFPFRNFSGKDGLSYPNITAAIEDSRGLLWVGTNNDLSWFDGKTFYQPPVPTLTGQLYVTGFYKDLGDQVWMTTFYNGLYRFAAGRFTQFLIDSLHPTANSNNVFDVLQLRDSDYLALTDQNAFLFDGRRFFLLDPDNPSLRTALSTAVQLGDGSLLIGGNRGILRYVKDGGRWRPADSAFRGQSITRILVSGDRIWVGTESGLYRFPSVRSLFGEPLPAPLFPGEFINCMTAAGTDSLWVFGKTLCLVAGGHITSFGPSNGLASAYVNNIYTDHRGVAWFCTNDGLSRLGRLYYRFERMDRYLAGNNSTTSLAMSADSTLWIGTQHGLLYRTRKDSVFHPLRNIGGVPIGFVSWFARGPGEALWCGTSKGILRLDVGRATLLSPLETTAECTGRSGDAWLGDSRGGIWHWEGGTFRPVPIRDKLIDFIDCLFMDREHDLWIGYRNSGVGIFHPDGDSLRLLRDFSFGGRPYNLRARCFLDDGNGYLLVGTRTSGVYVFSLAGNSLEAHIDSKQGLKASWVQDMVPGKPRGTVYLATDNGVFSLTYPYIHPEVRQVRFNNESFSNASYCLLACGPLLYIANEGLLTYLPGEDLPDTLRPPVYFTQLSLGGRQDTSWSPYATPPPGPSLDPDHHTVSFQFAGLDLDNAEGLQYQYMLEGLDNGWGSVTSRNSVAYDLEPGHYTFRVRARSESGRWSAVPATISFDIRPPFWQTLWFRVAALAFLAACVYLVYRIQLAGALRYEQLRAKISADLHDDMGSTLSSISILSEVAAKEDEPATKRLVREINQRSLLLMERMDDIVWSISLKNDTVGNLLLRIRQFASGLLEARDIDYEFEVPESIRPVRLNMLYRQHIYLILKEAIHNLAKYSDCTRARVLARQEGRVLRLVVEDNGVGFDRQTIRPGNGLANMEQRARSIGGLLDITSRPGTGTVVTLSVRMV